MSNRADFIASIATENLRALSINESMTRNTTDAMSNSQLAVDMAIEFTEYLEQRLNAPDEEEKAGGLNGHSPSGAAH